MSLLCLYALMKIYIWIALSNLYLIRWETCGPEVAKIVSIFEDIGDNGCKEKQNQTKKHHEDCFEPTSLKMFKIQ